jgi:chromosomal replication initiation ATPase DnaA
MEQLAWSEFCTVLERRIGPQNMEIWVHSGVLKPDALNGSNVRLKAESKYSYDWIRDNLLTDIESSWAESAGRPVQVELTWDGAPQAVVDVQAPRARRTPNHLDRAMTFDNFVVGDRKSTRLNSSHNPASRMPSSA